MKLKRRLELYNYCHPQFLCEYVDDPKTSVNSPLRQVAEPMDFPLKAEDKNSILRLMMNFGSREREYSLAAPQIGILKRLIVFSVPMGRGVVQTFGRSVWLNPVYDGIGDDTEVDYECCLSSNMVAPVERYKRITYKAFKPTGYMVTGEAQGVAARVIQHEVDHLDGKLITDSVSRDKLITIEEYKQKRKDAWQGKGWQDCIEEIQNELKELKSTYPPLPKRKRWKKKQRK